MKPVRFSRHAEQQLDDRGATVAEVEEAIRHGARVPAKRGRLAFGKDFPYHSRWKGREYATKQVMPIAVEEDDAIVVVTVYVFFFGAEP